MERHGIRALIDHYAEKRAEMEKGAEEAPADMGGEVNQVPKSHGLRTLLDYYLEKLAGPPIDEYKGMTISINHRQTELRHQEPHIHVRHGGHRASIEIASGRKLDGRMPKQQLSDISDWLKKERGAANEIWDTQDFGLIKRRKGKP